VRNSLLIFVIIVLLLFLPSGCITKSKPDTEGQSVSTSAAFPRENETVIDQSTETKVIQAFIESLRSADLKTLKQISKFPSNAPSPEQVLKKYGEDLSLIEKEELVISKAELGPGIDGVYFAGLKNDPGFILLAIKTEKFDNKYFVVTVTDDPDYEF